MTQIELSIEAINIVHDAINKILTGNESERYDGIKQLYELLQRVKEWHDTTEKSKWDHKRIERHCYIK